MSKSKVAWAAGATSLCISTRAVPHVVLSCGFCEPRRNGFGPDAVHVVVPKFCMTTWTLTVWPGTRGTGGWPGNPGSTGGPGPRGTPGDRCQTNKPLESEGGTG